MLLCPVYIKCQVLLTEKRVPVPGRPLQKLLKLRILHLWAGRSSPVVAGTLQATMVCHTACTPTTTTDSLEHACLFWGSTTFTLRNKSSCQLLAAYLQPADQAICYSADAQRKQSSSRSQTAHHHRADSPGRTLPPATQALPFTF